MRYILKYLFSNVVRIILYPLRIFSINQKLIVFNSYNGKLIACNPYFIYVYLKEHHPELDLVWVVGNKAVVEGRDVKYVVLNSFKYYYAIITANFYICNVHIPAHIPFRDRQIRIDTWHGGGAYKGTMYATNHLPLRKKMNHMIASNTTWKIASCRKFIEYAHKDQFLEINKFLKIGMPRCDIFFNKEKLKESSDKVRRYFNISDKSFVVLYAPTFRSNAHHPSFKLILDFLTLSDAIKRRFGANNIVLLFRGHHTFKKLMNLGDINEYNKKLHIIDTSIYQDTQAILCATDLLISDYSSIIWDFSFTYRPCFLFTPDLEMYTANYEMCTPIEKWGFPIARSNKELRQLIVKFDDVCYQKAIKQHHKDLGSYEIGTATENLCAYIVNEIERNGKSNMSYNYSNYFARFYRALMKGKRF